MQGEMSADTVIRSLKKARSFIEQAQSKGVNVDHLVDTFTTARPAFERGDLGTAYSHADRVVHGVATAMLEHTWKHILRAREDGKDVSRAKEFFNKVRIDVSKGLVDDVFKRSEECLGMMTRQPEKVKAPLPAQLYQEASECLQEIFTKIVEAQEKGTDVSEAGQLYAQARELIQTQDYEHVVRLCTDAIDMLTSPEEKHYKEASELIVKLGHDLADILQFGYGDGAEKLLLREVEGFLKDAKGNLQVGDSAAAINLAIRARDSLDQLESKFLRNSNPSIIQASARLIEEAKTDGMDVYFEETVLAEAKEANDKQEYIKARNLARKAQGSITTARHQQTLMETTSALNPIKKLISDCQKTQVDASKLGNLVSSIEEALEKKDYNSANRMLLAAKDNAARIRAELEASKAAAALGELDQVIAALPPEKQSDEIVQRGRKDAQTLFDKAQYQDCIDKIEVIKQGAKEAGSREELKKARDGLHKAKQDLLRNNIEDRTRKEFLQALDGLVEIDKNGNVEEFLLEAPVFLKKVETLIKGTEIKLPVTKEGTLAKLQDTERIIETMLLAEMEIKVFDDPMENAREAYDSSDLRAADDHLEAVRGAIDKMAQETWGHIMDRIFRYKDHGINTSRADVSTPRLDGHLKAKRYIDFFRALEDINLVCSELDEEMHTEHVDEADLLEPTFVDEPAQQEMPTPGEENLEDGEATLDDLRHKMPDERTASQGDAEVIGTSEKSQLTGGSQQIPAGVEQQTPTPEPTPDTGEPEDSPSQESRTDEAPGDLPEPQPTPAPEPEPTPEPQPEPQPEPAQEPRGLEDEDERVETCTYTIQSLMDFIEECQEKDIPTDRLEDIVRETMDCLERGELDRAVSLASEGIAEVEIIESSGPLFEEIQKLEDTLREARDLKADVQGAEDLYSKAKEEMKQGNLDQAGALINNAIEEAEKVRNIAKVMFKMPGM